jgi:acyl-CoA synthetase (AMP-forming)/AMP-acid ligase II
MAVRDPHLLDLLARASEHRAPVAFVTARGSRETTFHDLWHRSGRAANSLLKLGIRGRIAGVMTHSIEMVSSLLGALRAGHDFVSLPHSRRAQTTEAYIEQIERILLLAGVETVVADNDSVQLFAALSNFRILSAESLIDSSENARPTVDGDGALIQFSSGTTGVPKGVRLAGGAIGASIEATLEAYGHWPGGRCNWLPFSHDMGLIGGLFTGWASTSHTSSITEAPRRCVYISPGLFLARPLIWLETCASQASMVTAAPTFAYQILARQLRDTAAPLDLSSLKVCIVGAEPIHATCLTEFEEAARRHRLDPNAICPAYGLAEASLAVSIDSPSQHWSTERVMSDGMARDYVSCGQVLPCVEVKIGGATGQPGRIEIRGPAVCDGVLPPSGESGDGFRDTGDLGVLRSNNLVITGRSDDLLCLAGRNVFAWELETEVTRCAGVRAGNCAIVSDGRGRYIVLFEPTLTLDDPSGVLQAIRRRLASFAGIGPAGVGCLSRGQLPKTPSGKLQRKAIATQLEAFRDICIAYREF